MKKLLTAISCLLLFSVLMSILCSCEWVTEFINETEMQIMKATYEAEFENYTRFDETIPPKDPSSLANYEELRAEAQKIVDGGILSTKHYLISIEKVKWPGNTLATDVLNGADLTREDFETDEQFFNACLFYVLLKDSFGESLEEFVSKTEGLTDDLLSEYTEERVQMLTYLGEKSAYGFSAAAYSVQDMTIANYETFGCHDRALRLVFHRHIPAPEYHSTRAQKMVENERMQAEWEIIKICYKDYTNGTAAKEVLEKMIVEFEKIGEKSIYALLDILDSGRLITDDLPPAIVD